MGADRVNYMVRTTCALCSAAIDKVLDLGETPIANEYPSTPSPDQERLPLFLAECRDCGHLQMPIVVDPERLYRTYAYVSSTTQAFRTHLDDLARKIIQNCELAATDLVVDIGSNDGTLLEEFQARGMRCVGVDPALNLAGEASGRGVLTVPAFFKPSVAMRIEQLAGHADVITILNVFAHSHQLGDIAAGMKELLAPNGTIVIEVGSSSTVTDGIWDVVYAEHAAYHHLSPLTRFLDKYGLSVRAAETVSSQGGSIRVWAGHKTPANDGETEPPRPQVDWEAVRANVARRRENIRNAVLGAGRVGIYGVPAKATTLVHTCGLDGAFVAAYDDNPWKIGRYLPGTAIEIRPVSRMYEDGIDALFGCAWNFRDEIMAKRSAWRGKWIWPFPELEIVA